MKTEVQSLNSTDFYSIISKDYSASKIDLTTKGGEIVINSLTQIKTATYT